MELDVLLVVLHCLLTDGPDVVELALVKLPGVKHTGVVLPDVGMGIVLADCKGGLSRDNNLTTEALGLSGCDAFVHCSKLRAS